MKTLKITLLAAASLLCALSATAATFTPGELLWDTFSGTQFSRANVEAGGQTPTTSSTLTQFQTIPNVANDYVERVYGVFIPPANGNYIFDLSSDDDSDLFLSTDSSPANKRLVANVGGWTATLEWNNATAGHSAPIALVGGTQYYIEAVHHEGGGGDNLAVFYRLQGTSVPANGTVSDMTAAVIGWNAYAPPTALTITTQPVSATVMSNTAAVFRLAYNAQSDDTVTVAWKTNGVVVPGATGTSFTIIASAAYDGMQVSALVAIPHPGETTNFLEAASSAVTLNVSGPATSFPGWLKREYYTGQTVTNVDSGNIDKPTSEIGITSAETPTNIADNYAQRVSGYFIPPTSGDYNFIIATDDQSDLFLSTDNNPANKVRIAQETGWSGVRNWTTSNGGDSLQKNSSTYVVNVDDGMGGTTPTTPFASGIPLTAGTKYYIEAVHNEGGGGDNLAITYFLTGDTPPADGDAPKLTGANIAAIGVASQITTTLAPHNVTVFEGVNTNFTAGATTSGEFAPNFQWQFNGVDIAGQTGTTLPISAVLSASGTYSFIVTAPGATPVTNSAVLTVQEGITVVGYVKEEFYSGKDRPTVEGGTAGDPTYTSILNIFEIPVNTADGYTSKTYGFFTPPETGDYGFIIAADDDSDLFLSTNDNPSNKTLIAQETGWSGSRNWTGEGGGTLSQKNSTTYSVGGGTPFANGIHLVAGTKYYIEAVQHEGGGGDNMAVTFFGVDETTAADFPPPISGDAPRLTGTNISFITVKANLGITQQPVSQTVEENRNATFSITSTNDVTFPNTYQWRSNGVDIAGATLSTYTVKRAQVAWSGSTYSAVVSVFGGTPVTSTSATLTVTADTTRPVLVSAGTSTAGYIAVKFSEVLDSTTANDPANYTVAGATSVDSAVLNDEGKVVVLGVTGAPATGGTVAVKNVADLAGNAVAAGGATVNTAIFHSTNADIIDQDIGTPDPVGGAAALADSEWVVSAGGSDWWGNSDQVHFVGTKVTGDFDESVQVINVEPVNRWSKAGLDVRESLDGGARDMGVYASPAPVPVADQPDATSTEHYGNNLVENPLRNVTDDVTGGWQTAANPIPFPGGPSNPGFNPAGLGEDSSYTNVWVRLQRVGDVYNAYFGRDGTTWSLIATRTEPVPYTDQYVGLMLTAHSTILNTTHFGHWSLGGGVTPPPTPTLTYVQGNGTITLTWTGGLLLSSDTVNGTYADAGSGVQSGSLQVSTAAGNKFYVVRH